MEAVTREAAVILFATRVLPVMVIEFMFVIIKDDAFMLLLTNVFETTLLPVIVENDMIRPFMVEPTTNGIVTVLP